MKSIFAFLLLVPSLLLARPTACRVFIDLIGCRNDMVKVTVYAPELSGSSFRYVIPRSVPGTYSLDRYGRFVSDAKAFDKNGSELAVSRDSGDIIIAGLPAKLEYMVKDSWDDLVDNDVFQPTGTNIQQDTNFVINTHAFVGFFEGYKMIPYEIQVAKPRGFYGATSLDRLEINDTLDLLSAQTYPKLVDNPIMYCKPDTTSFMINNMNVVVSVYSPSHKVTSAYVAHELMPLAASLGKFFGVMPVTRYTFIMYFADQKLLSMGSRFTYGALEHSYSSLYFLPESSHMEGLSESILSTAGHEFLHILVPLNLHSEEVHDFDYSDPKMSQHLWLYEGCTEYFSHLSRAQDTLLTEKEFFENMASKIRTGNALSRNKAFSMTKFSRDVLSKEGQQLYPIVYETGAVLAFCLDIRIREVSGNKLDLLGVIRRMSERYGPDKPFKDDELFEEIENLVGTNIRSFFDDYIIGEKTPPWESFFNRVGYSFKDSVPVKAYQFNQLRVFAKQKVQDAVVLTSRSENDFGIMDGDTLLRINDTVVTPENKWEVLGNYLFAPKTEREVKVFVRRNGEELTLKASPKEKIVMRRNVLEAQPDASPEHVAFRKMMLKKN